MDKKPELLMPAPEAAELLGAGRATIDDLVRKGRLRGFHIPAGEKMRLYIPRAEAEALAQTRWRERERKPRS